MNKHILMVIDVGNTNISLGLVEKGKVIGSFRLTTKTPRTSDEFGICIRSLLDSSKVETEEIQDVIISSVVPKVMYALTASIKKYIKKTPLIVGPGMKTGIEIRTDNPKEVGADRLVDVVAVHNIYKRAVIVIDFGTATTFDFISEDGIFEYAVTAPGLQISADALTANAAKLPEIEIKKPEHILGKNTISGMQAGIVYGYIGLVEGIVKQMKKELGDESIYVVATGGLGRMIAKESDVIDAYDPLLAYKGMNILYGMNKTAIRK